MVTRCLDENSSTDVRKASEFLYDTYQKQMTIDEKKRKKVQFKTSKKI